MLEEEDDEFYLGRKRPEETYVYRQTGNVDFPNAFGTPLRYGYSCIYAHGAERSAPPYDFPIRGAYRQARWAIEALRAAIPHFHLFRTVSP